MECEKRWSVPEVAKMLGVSPGTIRKLIQQGEIPAMNVGTASVCRFLVSDEAIIGFVQKRTIKERGFIR